MYQLIRNNSDVLLQLGKWKNHSQSVDCTTAHAAGPHHKANSHISDSLDAGLGHSGSDPGGIGDHHNHDGRVPNGHSINNSRKAQKNSKSGNISVDKSSSGGGPGGGGGGGPGGSLGQSSTTGQNSHANHNDDQPKSKASWSEHVWSKYTFFI